MDNMNHIKQSPLSMTGMGGVVGGFNFKSASADKIYIDDVFSTYLYKGNASSRSIVNGIDLSGEGGMVWIKDRSSAYNHVIQDSVRGLGATTKISSNLANAENDGDNALQWSGYVSAFNSNVFSLDKTGSGAIDWANVNKNNDNYTSWSFRKASKWMDIKQWSGNGTDNRVISHDLGCVPGCIIMKDLEGSENWVFYHRDLPTGKILRMNKTHSLQTADLMGSTRNITSTGFTIGNGNEVNGSGKDYIAYIFQGGESDAATARSVDFDGNDYLLAASSSDFTLTGDFTMECWFKSDNVSGVHVILNGRGSASSGGPVIYTNGSSLVFDNGTGAVATASSAVSIGQWYHVAGTRSGNDWKLYLNGIEVASGTDSTSYSSSVGFMIGQSHHGNEGFDGKISNARVTKGQVLYTSSFRPSTEPLTQTSQGATSSNVELLCCNNSSVTGSTVTAGTISATGDPTASTDSPFDDPAGFAFGENEDQNLFKAGTFVGNGNNDGPSIYLGWEPQFILFRNGTTDNREWKLIDTMRGMPTGTGDATVLVNDSEAETGSQDIVDVSATGFKITSNNAHYNENGETIYYIAVRRPDGYVGKPAAAGTDVFTIDLGGINAGDPSWVSNFPVDMQFIKDRNGTTYNNFLSTRLTYGAYLTLSTNQAAIGNAVYKHDYNNGWGNYSSSDAEIITSWMWKRHKGMDVVCFKGNSANRQVAHSLNAVPEMIIVKQRTSATNWEVYHDGLNGGGNPEQYRIALTDSAETTDSTAWNDTAPTATHFSLGGNTHVNNNDEDLIALLFASVSGISKVGVYAGSNSAQSITTGFQPRFVMIKNTANTDDWLILDTFRGWGSGDDERLYLNQSSAQSDYDVGAPTSTGFDLNANVRQFNQAGRYYIYYAHA